MIADRILISYNNPKALCFYVGQAVALGEELKPILIDHKASLQSGWFSSRHGGQVTKRKELAKVAVE